MPLLGDKGALSPDKDREMELSEAISFRGKNLEALVRRLLPAKDSRACAQIAKAIELTADGAYWCEVREKTKLPWAVMSANIREHKLDFRPLWLEAKDAGEVVRHEIREAEAHQRAVGGWDEPVYIKTKKGIVTKHIRRFSDRLLELLLKAGDPGKYRESAASVNVNNNQIGVAVIFHRESKPEDPAPEDPAIPTESVTETLTDKPAEQKPQ